MKAYYYMAQAQVELGNFDDALPTAKQARNLCVLTNDKSLGQVTILVLRCKKERWEHMDRRRKREDLSLEGDMIAAIRREADEMIKTTDDAFERRDITQEYEAKILAVQKVFERSRENDDKKRVVPDWMICDITFNVFVDPVVVSLIRKLVIDRQRFYANQFLETNRPSQERVMSVRLSSNIYDFHGPIPLPAMP